MQRDDCNQSSVHLDRSHDLSGEAAVNDEHPLEGGIVVGADAIVLNDLPALLHLEDDWLRGQVDGRLAP